MGKRLRLGPLPLGVASRRPGPSARSRPTTRLGGRLRPVLLVHGILGQRHLYWNLFRKRLQADGFVVHEVSLPYVLLGDIRQAANALSEAVEDLRKEQPGARRIDIVAHSAGGLVARYYVQSLGGHKRVANLILLGTPHRGTLTAYLLPVLRVAMQTAPGSSLLGELDRRPPPAKVRITNFWSPFDGIVVPAENSILSVPGVRNVRLARMHHWGFLVSNTVCDQVMRVLRAPPGARGERRRPTS